MSDARAWYSRMALGHWLQDTCPSGNIGFCGTCRAGWALVEHPEWGGVLPVGWKDDVDFSSYDPTNRDHFRNAMRRAIKRASEGA